MLVDLRNEDEVNNYHRSQRIELPGAELVPLALRRPELCSFQHRFAIVDVGGQSRPTDFVAIEDTLVTIQ